FEASLCIWSVRIARIRWMWRTRTSRTLFSVRRAGQASGSATRWSRPSPLHAGPAVWESSISWKGWGAGLSGPPTGPRTAGRTGAIKVPRSGSFSNQDEQERFLREARSVAQLRHPSIASVYEVGQSDGTPYLVSEFVEGMTLADYLTGAKPSARDSAELVAK